MATPTVQAVKDMVRQLLGDTRVSGGAVYTDDGAGGKVNLQTFFEFAYRLAYRHMDESGVGFVTRMMHYVLPANTGFFAPSTAGVTNFGEPIYLYERQPRVTLTITGAVPAAATCRITTASAHGLTTGDTVIVYQVGGLTDDVNDEWVVTVINSTEVDLNGCIATGTFTSGGKLSHSTGKWSEPLEMKQDPVDLSKTSTTVLGAYTWLGDRFRFAPSDEDRQIRIMYSLSGNPPTTDTESVGFDDSLDYFAYCTAALACESTAPSLSAALLSKAIGPRMDWDNPGGLLGQILSQGVRTLNNANYQTQRWRKKRNVGLRRGVWS